MNSAPRWFWIASGVLALNFAVVVSSGFWRYLAADEPATARRSLADNADNSAGQSDLPIPEALPEIPSLTDPERIKTDPGFQEFRRMFEEEVESWGANRRVPPGDSLPDETLIPKPKQALQQSAYFDALERRLETVEQLCIVARRVAAEAAQQARSGGSEQSHEMLQMTTQLREMAAKLLVTEL